MRKLILSTILTGLMGTSIALAIPSTGVINMDVTPGSQYSDGGQFTGDVAGYGSFQTFCIEIYYEFTPGHNYDYTLGQDTHGVPPVTASPVLNLGTAWLFAQFSWAGVNLAPTQAGELQAALWYFQGQGANPNGAFSGLGFGDGLPGANPYTDAALLALGASAYLPSAGAYGVQIIEAHDAAGVPAQDWLYVPDGGMTIMLLGLGLIGLGLLSRRLAVAR